MYITTFSPRARSAAKSAPKNPYSTGLIITIFLNSIISLPATDFGNDGLRNPVSEAGGAKPFNAPKNSSIAPVIVPISVMRSRGNKDDGSSMLLSTMGILHLLPGMIPHPRQKVTKPAVEFGFL